MYRPNEIGEKIKEIAKEKNISVRKMLIESNLSESTIRNMKTSMPNVETIVTISKYLEYPIEKIIGIEKVEQKEEITKKEKEILQAYKKAPKSVQQGIDTLLEPYKENKKSSEYKIG